MLRKIIQFVVTEVINAIAKRLEEEKAASDQAVARCPGSGVMDADTAHTGSVKIGEGRSD